jgi:hypothetical protein
MTVESLIVKSIFFKNPPWKRCSLSNDSRIVSRTLTIRPLIGQWIGRGGGGIHLDTMWISRSSLLIGRWMFLKRVYVSFYFIFIIWHFLHQPKFLNWHFWQGHEINFSIVKVDWPFAVLYFSCRPVQYEKKINCRNMLQ